MTPEDQARLHKATAFVLHHHASQKRKGSSVPYVSHLLQVSGSVLEYGGNIDQAIAALCHDTLEDCDDIEEMTLIAQFGHPVAAIVVDCTDTIAGDTSQNKSDWLTRKQAYLDHLSQASAQSVLVAACDKLHNLTSIVADVRSEGIDYLERFNATPPQQLWYFSEFLKRTHDRLPNRLTLAFKEQLRCFETQLQAADLLSQKTTQ